MILKNVRRKWLPIDCDLPATTRHYRELLAGVGQGRVEGFKRMEGWRRRHYGASRREETQMQGSTVASQRGCRLCVALITCVAAPWRHDSYRQLVCRMLLRASVQCSRPEAVIQWSLENLANLCRVSCLSILYNFVLHYLVTRVRGQTGWIRYVRKWSEVFSKDMWSLVKHVRYLQYVQTCAGPESAAEQRRGYNWRWIFIWMNEWIATVAMYVQWRGCFLFARQYGFFSPVVLCRIGSLRCAILVHDLCLVCLYQSLACLSSLAIHAHLQSRVHCWLENIVVVREVSVAVKATLCRVTEVITWSYLW
jgi:hypothetical protein